MNQLMYNIIFVTVSLGLLVFAGWLFIGFLRGRKRRREEC